MLIIGYIIIDMITIKQNLLKIMFYKLISIFVGFVLLLISLSVQANNFLDLGCLSNYQSLLKPVDSLEVSAMPAPVKIKMSGVKSYSGELPPHCQGQVPAGTLVKIYSLNNKLYSLDLTIKTLKPYYSQFLGIKEISGMEASLRKNNFAASQFATGIDKGITLGYQIEFVIGGFEEHLSYKSPESAKYE